MIFFEDVIPEKITNFVNGYKAELLMICVSSLLIFISFFLLFVSGRSKDPGIVLTDDASMKQKENIFVHISGSVMKPDVYELSAGSRMRDVLARAGGLSIAADREYFDKNLNLARILADQEKIYIPSKEEIASGANFSITKPQNGSSTEDNQNGSIGFISINSGSMKDLESLPGVGLVTAEKIISNRPYERIEDLVERKIIGTSLYEKISTLIVN